MKILFEFVELSSNLSWGRIFRFKVRWVINGWLRWFGSMAVCFDFCSTNVVQLSNRNLYFYWFWCHHPLITQLNFEHYFFFISLERLLPNLKNIIMIKLFDRWEFQKITLGNSVSPMNAKSPKFQVDVKKSYWFWLWNSSGLE